MEKRLVQFIGVTDEQWNSAVRIWGQPDFVSKWYDYRSLGNIDWDNDIVVLGDKGRDKPIKWSWQDQELW